MPSRLKIVEGDLAHQPVDAVVNAANQTLLGGGGVDGALHRAAGPQLLAACRALPQVAPGVRCPTGEARITPGYNLPARWAIHTVGPIWRGGGRNEEALLAACYRNSLALAAQPQYDIKTVAFPSISTGAYRFPQDKAARIALTETKRFIEGHADLERVFFVCFGQEAYEKYQKTTKEVLG